MKTDRSSKIIAAVLLTAAFLATQSTAQAAAINLFWDPGTTGAPSDGSGTWHGGSTWWNGAADQAWADGNVAVFGATTPGPYTVTLDSQVNLTFVAFKTNSYTLSGSTLFLTNGIVVSNGVTAAITCPITTPGGAGFTVNNGSILTLGGGYTSLGGNPGITGKGAAVSTVNITNGTYTEGGTFTGDAITINQTGGTVNFTIWNMGRNVAGPAIWNLSGGILKNPTANGITISRGKTALLNVSGTGLLGAVGNIGIGSTTVNDDGTLNVLGGTANIGTGAAGIPGQSSASLGNLNLLAVSSGTYAAAAKAALNISGGITTAKGIAFGNAAASYVNHPASTFTLSGGTLYLDVNGIAITTGVSGFATPTITLSGGTLAATANWTGSVPMTLTNVPSDLTVQAADVNGTPFNITLSGGLSGLGGLIKTGGGVLTLSGADSYSGTTTVGNGQLTVTTAAPTSIGPVVVTSGTTLSSVLTAAGKSWTNSALSFGNNVVLDFNFGGFQASPSSRVIQVNGDLTLDSSDTCTLEGSALITGTFPLITCTGTLTLAGGVTLPNITSLPSGVVAHLAQSGKTINLVVTSSPNSPLNWGPLAAGPWDFTTKDWINAGNGSPTNYYSDGLAVTLNDNATSAVAITLNATVQPVSVTVNNTAGGTASYTITGPGSIAGNASVLVQGTGLLALGTTNTYSGGTVVNSGTLGINYGGDGSGPSGIGTGPLTLNAGATLDNTSGSDVVLNTPLTENWNGDFSYAGSQTNLHLGTGPVVLGTSVVVTVQSNTLSCGGTITDNGLGYQLSVQGPGALTLSGANTYSGGTVLNSGKLNINYGGDGGADSAVGTGRLTINGGTIDNTSGADLQLQTAIPETWNTSFTFAGTTNLDLGSGTLTVQALTLTLQNGATLRTEGGMVAAGSGGIATMTLTGNGTFQTSGTHNNTSPGNTGLSAIVNNGALFQLDKTSSSGVHSILNLNVNAGGTARVTGTGGFQIGTAAAGTLTLGGGLFDLNGSSESIFAMNFSSGTLQNSSTNTLSTLTLLTRVNLTGAACKVDVATNSEIAIPSLVLGAGSLTKIGDGKLSLGGTNTYTGSTTVSNGLLSFTTATLAAGNYTVAGGQLQAVLDPLGASLQMAMSNLTFGAGTRVGFDLASGAFGDTASPLIAAGALTLNGNVAVDVANAPADTGDDVLLSYTSRQGPGLFVAGNVPPGAFVYDNTANRTVVLTYTAPPPPAPAFATVGSVISGGVLTGITLSAIHGPANGSYEIRSSTNVALHPLSAWTLVQSGSFDNSGSFNVTVSANPAAPQTFYLVRVP